MTTADRARAYLAKLPPAIAGSGGHAATFAAACRLVEFGLNEADAGPLLCEWNGTHCQPPWPEAQLSHKLADAFRHTAAKAEFTEPARMADRRWKMERAPRPAPSAIVHPPSSPDPVSRRPSLPAALRPGSAADCERLAELRALAPAGVALASARGLLRFGTYRGQAAWFILDASQRIAQARRLDGQPWAAGVKAWTLAGSAAAWPVGIGEAAPFPAVALVEGGPDLLAACHFIAAQARAADAAPVAMMGASCAIAAEALPHFTGKRVRIFRHVDEAGDKAAHRWAEQLASVGADVDAFAFDGLHRRDGQPVADLCDLAQISADDFEAHACLWNLIP
jgi:hypothetical protein